MDKFDTPITSEDDSLDNQETLEDDITPGNNTLLLRLPRYKYILYIVLFVIFVLLVIWVIRVLLTNEPPLLVLNEMLNIALQTEASSD